MTVRKRNDIAAATRRVTASVGRRALSAALGAAAVVTATTGVVAGLESTVTLAIVVALASVAVYRAPDWFFETPDPAVDRGVIAEDGMTDKEVMRRFAIVRERDRRRAEKVEEERKRSERKAKAQGKF